MDELWKKNVALITGGASGIGFAFATRLHERGYRIAIADLKGAQQAAERLGGAEGCAIALEGNASDEGDVQRMVAQTCAIFGGIDVLVNNAAIFTTLKPKPFEQLTVKEFGEVMSVNVMGPFLCAKSVVPEMRKRGGGRIVNIASTVALKGTPNMLHYVASKGALISMTRSLARELGKDNITVNSIAPGFTLSDGVLAGDLQNHLTSSISARAIQRAQTPEDLLGALEFLVGTGAAFVTGQTIIVDGGSAFG